MWGFDEEKLATDGAPMHTDAQKERKHKTNPFSFHRCPSVPHRWLITSVCFCSPLLLFFGCKSPPRGESVAAKGRAQLWQENCIRCHNARPASWYDQREWEVAMHHMQVRGYLTGDETRAISEFFRGR